MGVRGDAVEDTFFVRHYGSLYTEEEYTTTSHFAYLTANYIASPKLTVFGTFSYSKHSAEYDEVIMPDVTTEVSSSLSHQDFTFEEMHTYSDLDYGYLRFLLGFEYKFTPRLTWTADGDMAKFTDDAPYVFGDETGSLFMIRSGFKLDF